MPCKSGRQMNCDVFDFGNPKTRTLFISACINATKTGFVDGCFIDRAVDASPSQKNESLAPEVAAAYTTGHKQMLADLQSALDNGPLVANHACE